MYISEKAFCSSVIKKLKKEGTDYYRVETGSTCRGFPDLYVMTRGIDCFMELKNDKKATLDTCQLKVDWRPGQQAFARKYTVNSVVHRTGSNIVKFTWTFVSVVDGVIAVRMDSMYPDNLVPTSATSVWKFGVREWRDLDLSLFLRVHTAICHVSIATDDNEETYKKQFAEEIASLYYKEADGMLAIIKNVHVNLALVKSLDLSRSLSRYVGETLYNRLVKVSA